MPTNILDDPGFDEQDSSWSLVTNASYINDDALAFCGGSYLQLIANNGASTDGLARQVIDVTAGDTLAIEAWVSSEDIVSTTDDSRIIVQIGGFQVIRVDNTQVDKKWIKYTGTHIPPTTATVNFEILTFRTGGWFGTHAWRIDALGLNLRTRDVSIPDNGQHRTYLFETWHTTNIGGVLRPRDLLMQDYKGRTVDRRERRQPDKEQLMRPQPVERLER